MDKLFDTILDYVLGTIREKSPKTYKIIVLILVGLSAGVTAIVGYLESTGELELPAWVLGIAATLATLIAGKFKPSAD